MGCVRVWALRLCNYLHAAGSIALQWYHSQAVGYLPKLVMHVWGCGKQVCGSKCLVTWCIVLFYLFGCSHSIDWPQMDQVWSLFVLHWSCGVTSRGRATTMQPKCIKLNLDLDLGLKLCFAHDWLNLNLLSANLPKQRVYEVIEV